MAVIGNPSTATTYNYDGEGRRVQKITTSGTTNYVYDAMGHLAAEYGGSSTSAGRVYLSVDALGSTRLVTDASGNPTTVARSRLLPHPKLVCCRGRPGGGRAA
jgi:uncharacterized protein RhaS with RHS repeats